MSAAASCSCRCSPGSSRSRSTRRTARRSPRSARPRSPGWSSTARTARGLADRGHDRLSSIFFARLGARGTEGQPLGPDAGFRGLPAGRGAAPVEGAGRGRGALVWPGRSGCWSRSCVGAGVGLLSGFPRRRRRHPRGARPDALVRCAATDCARASLAIILVTAPSARSGTTPGNVVLRIVPWLALGAAAGAPLALLAQHVPQAALARAFAVFLVANAVYT